MRVRHKFVRAGVFDRTALFALSSREISWESCAGTGTQTRDNEVEGRQQADVMAIIEAEPYRFDLNPARTSLLIIDMQRDLLEPGGICFALTRQSSEAPMVLAEEAAAKD